MILREEYEKREEGLLAPYAVKSGKSRGRKYPEPPCPVRLAFQRDKDRIVHSGAFRRLEYKTQVFVNHEGDYYRTRLTHTLEVAGISRGLARTLRLNEDLAEAIALAHDLGHTPFGHRGEAVLSDLMASHGGFEHNRQSYRVVTLLERRYPDFPGLNLSIEVLEGIVKHTGEYDKPNIDDIDFETSIFPFLEAQIVNVADEIAYMNHDLDDGIESGMLDIDELDAVPLWRGTIAIARKDHGDMRPKMAKQQTIRRLINILVTDILAESKQRIDAGNVKKIEDIAKQERPLIGFSEEMAKRAKELKSYLFTNLYRHFRVERMADKSTRIIQTLFKTYLDNPAVLPPSLAKAIKTEGDGERKVCDYIAGMTDRYALSEYAKLFDPNERV